MAFKADGRTVTGEGGRNGWKEEASGSGGLGIEGGRRTVGSLPATLCSTAPSRYDQPNRPATAVQSGGGSNASSRRHGAPSKGSYGGYYGRNPIFLF